MNTTHPVESGRRLLADRLSALQRCGFYLGSSIAKIRWPLQGDFLEERKMDPELFETLSAINERFAKLQDTLGSAMRQSMILTGASEESFLRILSFFEKLKVIESAEEWIACRAMRNLAAHDYDTNYHRIAEHFNELRRLLPGLLHAAKCFTEYCDKELNLRPSDNTFTTEFERIVQMVRGLENIARVG